MTSSLRPMTLGEILDRTFQIYRSRFGLFFGIAALPIFGLAAIEWISLLLWGTYSRDMLDLGFGITTGELGAMLGFYHFALLFQLLLWPGFIKVASATYLSAGTQSRMSSIFRNGITPRKSWLGTTGLVFLLVLVVPEITAFAFFLGVAFLLSEVLKENEAFMDLVLPPALVFTCIAAWLLIGWMNGVFSFAVPSRTLEGCTTGAAMGRARRLSRGSRLRLFAAWFMPAILTFVLNLAITRSVVVLRSGCAVDRLIFFRMFTWTGRCVSPAMVESVRIFLEAISTGLLIPVFPIALTLIYYDQRVRHEGFDIEWMMRQAGMVAEPPSLAADAGIVETNSPTGEPA
jgi:hypothetical protein